MVSETKQVNNLPARVLEVAHRRFYAHGFRRVTMNEIARELRISKKTLYTVIPDKQALVRSCVDNVLEQVASKVAESIDGPGGSAARLMAITRIVSQLPRMVSPIMLSDLQQSYSELWSKVEAHRRSMFQGLEDALTKGKLEGEICREIDPKVFVRMVIAVIDQTFSPEAVASGEYTIESATNTLMTWISHGIFQSGSDPSPAPGAASS